MKKLAGSMLIQKSKSHNLEKIVYPQILGRCQSTAVESKPKDDFIQKTGLYDSHILHGGKMVNFAGYYLPIQYGSASITASHLYTRKYCSVFDVSHMLQTRISGKYSTQLLESLCVTDVAGMESGQSTLSLFIDDLTGGIFDDLIITKINDNTLYVVSNASRQDIVKSLLIDALGKFEESGKNVYVEFLDCEEQSLLAIQGPRMMQKIQKFTNIDLSKLYFMSSAAGTFCGVNNCRINRCGYTGEDGVEISIPTDKVQQVVDMLLQVNEIKLAGLGARDTLRLEAGLCLYGNDIDLKTTPVEAGLSWTISKLRRQRKDFPGCKVILNQLTNGVNKKRVGIIQTGGPPARSGCKILGNENETIGYVTSGSPSPSLGINIAMGYVPQSYSKSNMELKLNVRNNLYEAVVSKMPFINARYYFKPE